MAVELTEIKTYKVTMRCDKCQIGSMLPTPISRYVDPEEQTLEFNPTYSHTYDYCGDTAYYNRTYPYTQIGED